MQTLYAVLQLQQNIWREMLEFASATLTSSTEPAMFTAGTSADAGVKTLLASCYPQGLRQKLQLLGQFQTWQCSDAVLSPLALPTIPNKVGGCTGFPSLCVGHAR